MKFEHLSIEIQKIAAEHLAAQLGARVNMEDKNRMEQAKKISETIRVAFEELFLNSHISHETSITIHAAPE